MALTWEKFVEKLCTEAQSDALYHHPIGSIYQSLDSTSPAELFGGTWSAISAGTFLVAAGTGYTAGSTGGGATHLHTLVNGYSTLHVDAVGSGWIGNIPKTVAGLAATNVGYTKSTSVGNYPVPTGTALGGSTDSASSLPPYLVIYMWERTA